MPQDRRAVAVDTISVGSALLLESQHAAHGLAVRDSGITVESNCPSYSAHLIFLLNRRRAARFQFLPEGVEATNVAGEDVRDQVQL